MAYRALVLIQVAAGRHEVALTEHGGTAGHPRNGAKIASAVRDEADHVGCRVHVVEELAVAFASPSILHEPPVPRRRRRVVQNFVVGWRPAPVATEDRVLVVELGHVEVPVVLMSRIHTETAAGRAKCVPPQRVAL